MRLPAVLSTSLVLAIVASPTLGQQLDNAGLGAVKRMFDASARTVAATSTQGNVRLTGVAYINGSTFVGSDNTGQTATTYVFDSTGTLIRQFNTATSTNDLANDGNNILAASASGVWVYDRLGTTQSIVMAQNGPQNVSVPIAGPGVTQLGGFRGLAYDPTGNGGNGSFFVGNVGQTDPILEIDTLGNILNTYPNQGWLCSGLARDPVTGNLWCMNSINTGTSAVIELDASQGMAPTGNSFDERWHDFNFQGGLDAIRDSSGGPASDSGSYPSHFDIVSITRLNGPDWLVYHRIHLVNGVLGYDEAFMEGAINLNPPGRGNLGSLGQINLNDVLTWNLNPGTGPCIGCPGLFFFVVGPDAARTGVTTFLNMWETQVLWPLSTPASASLFILPMTVGGPSASVVIPPGVINAFELFRLQGAYVELNSTPPQIIATNEVFTHGFDEATADIVVEATGANSFNADITSGFFRVLHKGGPGIQDIEFDWGTGTDPNQYDMRFDTDNPNMADRFEAGNSTVAGCNGTYRNNSHITTGLIFDGNNTTPSQVTLACNPNANSGFIGSDSFGATIGSWRKIKFRFTNFQGGMPGTPVVFEFDADTDGGIGVTGDAMAGCVVRVTLTNGVVKESELRGDPAVANRSVAGF